MCMKHCKAIGPPKSDNLGPYTTVYQTLCKTSTFTERAKPMRNLWCPVSCSYHIIWHPTRSLSFFISSSLSGSLSLSLCVVLWQFPSNYSDNLSDNHLLHSVRWPSHRAMSITLERHERTWVQNERNMHANGRKMKGCECRLEWKWKEHEGSWREMDTNERNMKGKWQENDRKFIQIERKMHANERT